MEIIQSIQNRIYEIRGYRVMLDYDLADLYEVPTKVLNQAVKRNLKRFPVDFMFRLTTLEWDLLRSQFVTASGRPNNHSGVIVSQIYDALENLLDEKAAQRKWEDRERIGFKR